MSNDKTLTADDLIRDFEALRANDPELASFYRNQQRFLHLYALARGAVVTADAITRLVQALDPTRTFGTRTYYQLRRELEDDDWIESTERPGREENPHRIKPGRRGAFVEEVIRGSLVDRPVALNKYRLFDAGLRFNNLADRARRDPALLDEIEAILETIRAGDDELAFYPGFVLRRFGGELLDLARTWAPAARGDLHPTVRDKIETLTDGPGVRWVRRIWEWEGWTTPLIPLPMLGGMRGGHRETSRSSARSGTGRAVPSPRDTLLLIELAQGDGGQVELQVSGLLASLGGGELRYGRTTQRLGQGDAVEHQGTEHARWDFATSMGLGELLGADSPSLRLSLIGPGVSAALLALDVQADPGGRRWIVTVTSYSTGIKSGKLGCLVGGGHGAVDVPIEAGDHWQARMDIGTAKDLGILPFAFWITGADTPS